MNRTKSLAALAALAAVTVLSGCSSPHTSEPETTRTPSAVNTADTVDYGTCVDGHLTLLASQAHAGETVKTVDCAAVAIVGTSEKDVTFEVGTVDRLVLEGHGLTVNVGSAKEIIVPGNQNSVAYDGASKVEDLGSGNSITAN